MKITQMMLCLFIIGVGAIVMAYTGLVEREGFLNAPGTPAVRCGVDLPTCVVGTQCVNGFCSGTAAPALLANQLPVF